MARSKVMYGISRIDDDHHRTHAWRVSLRRQGKLLVKNFPDKSFGGKRKALKAAKEHRDEVVAAFPPTTRQQMCSIVRRNNKSGIPGVYSYYKSYELKDGTIKKIKYWEADWPVGKNESAKASFSVKTYGERAAKRMAISAREEGVSKINGVIWSSDRL